MSRALDPKEGENSPNKVIHLEAQAASCSALLADPAEGRYARKREEHGIYGYCLCSPCPVARRPLDVIRGNTT